VFRIERTEILNKTIKIGILTFIFYFYSFVSLSLVLNFCICYVLYITVTTYVDNSFGTTTNSVFYIRFEEENKLDCIVGIK
jgi:hypothetical protein